MSILPLCKQKTGLQALSESLYHHRNELGFLSYIFELKTSLIEFLSTEILLQIAKSYAFLGFSLSELPHLSVKIIGIYTENIFELNCCFLVMWDGNYEGHVRNSKRLIDKVP